MAVEFLPHMDSNFVRVPVADVYFELSVCVAGVG